MNKVLATVAAAVLAAVVVTSSGAKAAVIYDFTFVGSTFDVAGTFATAATVNSDGTYNITSATGTFSATSMPLLDGTFTLVPGNGPALTGPGGTELYSNLYDPTTNSFAYNGLLVTGSNFLLNLYNGANALYPPCTADCASVPQAGGNLYDPGDIGITTITAVPELSTWAMMIIGFLGLGWLARRRVTSSAARFA
jgi:hypothetical protein